MALTIVEAIKAQTTSSTGTLNATFTLPPLIGDRIIAFVTLEFTGGYVDKQSFSVSGLGASWRLLYTNAGFNGSQLDWYGVYEAIGVNGIDTTITASESASVTTVNFSVACFNVRGVPTGSQASAVYGVTTGVASNPPALSVTPAAAGDAVMGMWYQYTSATAPTITTVPSSGYSTFSTTMTAMSLHWRYKVAADTSAHTMDSGTAAMYTSFGLASQLGPVQITQSGVDILSTPTAPVRRYDSVRVEAMLSPLSRKYNQVMVEVMVSQIPLKGWGISL
jgi:hypothetical protein